ncbi:MAG: Fic family protein [Candidatus Kapaibacterium sp.]
MKTAPLYPLPPDTFLETPEVMRRLVKAHRYLAELKGIAKTIPNEHILISTLTLQEAQNSSAIENIITTQDALYKYKLKPESQEVATKEVADYASALEIGFRKVAEVGLLTLSTILDVQATLEGNNAGFRKVPGTVLQNQQTGEIVFTPPSPEKIPELMGQLEQFIHLESQLDPLIRMSVIHHYFETIHPFYDGNRRTGRIINILFLVKEGLLDTPILYLSRYINQTKGEYYRLLQRVREKNEWTDWLIYMLRGISRTAQHTIHLVQEISKLLLEYKHQIRERHKFYSQDLINNIFRHPYTKVAFLEEELGVSRATAARYLDALADDNLLSKEKLGRENYYVNRRLVELLFDLPGISRD